MNDWSLIHEYVNSGSETAFGELVRRHIDMVYGTALRQTRDPHRAEEVTQAVFVLLARKAATLGRNVIVGGWLYRAACLSSLQLLRDERRRETKERSLARMPQVIENPTHAAAHGGNLNELETHLDAALSQLADKDRTVLVLRYLEQQSFADVAEAVGISEDAAKKRASRSLEKLRALLGARGLPATTAVLITAMHQPAKASPHLLEKAIAAGGQAPVVGPDLERLVQMSSPLFTPARALMLTGSLVALVLIVTTLGGLSRAPQSAIRTGALSSPEVRQAVPGDALTPSLPLASVEGRTIIVRVLSAESDTPLADAEVSVRFHQSPRVELSGRSDRSGEFCFKIPDGPFQGMGVIAGAPGRIPLQALWRKNEEGSLPPGYTFRLREGKRLIGRVIDDSGLPVESALLHFNAFTEQDWSRRERPIYGQVFSTPVSGRDGYWEGNFFEPSTKIISGHIEHPEFAETTFSREIDPASNETIVLTLDRKTSNAITGSIEDARHEPIPHAAVVLKDTSGWRSERRAIASGSGTFNFDAVGRGEYRIIAKVEDFQPAEALVRLSGTSTNIVITLEPVPEAGNAILRGRVVTDNGTPVTHSSLRIVGEKSVSWANWSIPLDSQGRFEWLHAPAQEITLQLKFGTPNDPTFTVFPDGAEHELRLPPEDRINLRGTIRDAETGAAIPLTKLMIKQAQTLQEVQTEWLGEAYNGIFSISVEKEKILPNPRFGPSLAPAQLLVQAEGYAKKTCVLPQQTNEITVTILLTRGTRLTGRIFLPTGEPAVNAAVGFRGPGYGVYMTTPGDFTEPRGPEQIQARTGFDGTFELEKTFDAQRVLITHPAGWANVAVPDNDQLQVTLERWGRVEGISRTKFSVGATRAMLRPADFHNIPFDRMNYQFEAEIDETGRFVFDKVPGPAAVVSLMVQTSFSGLLHDPRVIEVRPGQTTHVELAESGVKLSGRLIVPGTNKVNWLRSAQVIQRATGGAPGEPRWRQTYGFFCREDGSFELDAITPGKYMTRLEAIGDNDLFDEIGNRRERTLGELNLEFEVGTTDVDLGPLVLR